MDYISRDKVIDSICGSCGGHEECIEKCGEIKRIEGIPSALEVVTFCDVIDDCQECPKYGQDCDGREEEIEEEKCQEEKNI